MAGVGTPDRVLALGHDPGRARCQVEHRDREPALPDRERDFFAIGRPFRLGAISVAGRDEPPASAAGADAEELRASALVGRIDDFRAVRRPRGRGLDGGGVREPVRSGPVRPDGVELGVPVLADRAGDPPAVRREGRAGISAREFDDAVSGAGVQVDQVDVCVSALVAGVGQLRAVMGKRGGDTDVAVVGELLHVRAVIVGGVDFFVPCARGSKRDFRRGDSLVAGDRLDDVVGKLMRGRARAPAVGFSQNDAARMVGHRSLDRTVAGRSPHGKAGPLGRGQQEQAGKFEVVLDHFRRRRALGASERFDRDAGRVAFFYRDRRFLCGERHRKKNGGR